MVDKYQKIFSSVAASMGVYILVRKIRDDKIDRIIEEYVGKANYIPKPMELKVKTADRDGYFPQKHKALIVDPDEYPESFDKYKIKTAKEEWKKFQRNPKQKIEENASTGHLGCLKDNGKYVYTDFDLYDIVVPERTSENVRFKTMRPGEYIGEGYYYYWVKFFINQRFGAEVINHGPQMQYDLDTGDKIDMFYPFHHIAFRPRTLTSSQVLRRYNQLFKRPAFIRDDRDDKGQIIINTKKELEALGVKYLFKR